MHFKQLQGSQGGLLALFLVVLVVGGAIAYVGVNKGTDSKTATSTALQHVPRTARELPSTFQLSVPFIDQNSQFTREYNRGLCVPYSDLMVARYWGSQVTESDVTSSFMSGNYMYVLSQFEFYPQFWSKGSDNKQPWFVVNDTRQSTWNTFKDFSSMVSLIRLNIYFGFPVELGLSINNTAGYSGDRTKPHRLVITGYNYGGFFVNSPLGYGYPTNQYITLDQSRDIFESPIAFDFSVWHPKTVHYPFIDLESEFRLIDGFTVILDAFTDRGNVVKLHEKRMSSTVYPIWRI